MADAYIIEVEGLTAGIVSREHGREAFTFFASHPVFYGLEGKRFAAPASASRAALNLLRQEKRLETSRLRRTYFAAPLSELNL